MRLAPQLFPCNANIAATSVGSHLGTPSLRFPIAKEAVFSII
jgi:hypothetical protein